MAAGFAAFQCSGVLSMLLTSTFLDRGFVPESIAGTPNAGGEARNVYNANQGEKQWVSERTVPNFLRNNGLVRKLNRSTLTLTFAPEKHNVDGVFAPESHPTRNMDSQIIFDKSIDLRVVEFGEATAHRPPQYAANFEKRNRRFSRHGSKPVGSHCLDD